MVTPTTVGLSAEDLVLKPIGDSIWVVSNTRGVTIEFSRIVEHHDSLSAEVLIAGTDGHEIHWGRVNLVSTQGRSALVKVLEEAEPTGDWRRITDRSCRMVAKHVRTGEPAVPLIAEPPSPEQYIVDGTVPKDQPTVLFGDGASGKSFTALALSVSGLLRRQLSARWRVAPLRRVLYLDWEASRAEQQARLWRLTQGFKSEPVDGALLHRTMRRPLIDDIVAIRAEVARQQVDFVVVDSLAPACGPEPETAGSVVPCLLALRSLATTVLIIAHVSKSAADAKAPARPFGSVFVQNLARSVIEARGSESEGDSRDLVVTFFHRKVNSGARRPPSALRFEFAPSGVITISPGSPDSSGASVPFRILQALKSGPKKPGQLAEELDEPAPSIKKNLQRLENRDAVMRIPGHEAGGRGKEQEWALVTNRDANRDTDPFAVPVCERDDDAVPF
jgi:AAA domain